MHAKMESSSSILKNPAMKIVYVIVITFCISFSSATSRNIPPSSCTEFIKSSCKKTLYPQLCYSSLSSHASYIQTSPKLLVGTALNVTLAKAKSVSSTMVNLSKAHGLKPREVAAMQDCVEEVGDSVYELRKSIAEMNEFRSHDYQLMISDLLTWVSAALTDENTCSDGFAGKGMDGSIKAVVRKEIVALAHLTSNALALINNYSSLHG